MAKVHGVLVELQQQRQGHPDANGGGDRQEQGGCESGNDHDLRGAPRAHNGGDLLRPQRADGREDEDGPEGRNRDLCDQPGE